MERGVGKGMEGRKNTWRDRRVGEGRKDSEAEGMGKRCMDGWGGGMVRWLGGGEMGEERQEPERKRCVERVD